MVVILESGQKVERREHMKSGIGPTEINSKVVAGVTPTIDLTDARKTGSSLSVQCSAARSLVSNRFPIFVKPSATYNT